SAIGAVNNGAFYYIQKPFKNEELVTIVRRAAEHRSLKRENKTLKAEAKRRDRSGRPVGSSKSWLDALHVAESVAGTDSTVLLQGESGTGKEVVARYIHDLSTRAGKPFLSINCGALPESLLESELFGHVKGSFTGASRDKEGLFSAAGEGTFFLDEIGETTPATQVKLLRVLQQREVMQRYSWPANVRELENALERAVILAKGDTIPLSALPERVVEPRSDPLVSDAVQTNPTLDTIERAYIMWVLENEGGNKPRTA